MSEPTNQPQGEALNRYRNEFERWISRLRKKQHEFEALLNRYALETARRPYDDPPKSISVHNTCIAMLTPQQLRSIGSQGGRIEVSTSRMDEGTYPYIVSFIHLDWPAALGTFLDALFNKGTVVHPSQNLPNLSAAGKLFVCGFFNAQDGSYLVNSIQPKA